MKITILCIIVIFLFKFSYNQSIINVEINKTIDHIRESLFKNYLEADINLNSAFLELKTYLKNNVLNYKEIKKVLKYDHKHIISPKTNFKKYLEENLKSNYYIKNVINA